MPQQRETFEALREVNRLQNIRLKQKPDYWNVRRLEADGSRLERWFLKTLINVAVSQNQEHTIGDPNVQSSAGLPSDEMVRIAFGLCSFKKPAGLYILARPGRELTLEDRVNIRTFVAEGTHLAAGIFAFRGLEFFLSLTPDLLAVNEFGFQGSQLLYHDVKFRFQVATLPLCSCVRSPTGTINNMNCALDELRVGWADAGRAIDPKTCAQAGLEAMVSQPRTIVLTGVNSNGPLGVNEFPYGLFFPYGAKEPT
jgi:hypothetical protein